MKKISKKVMIMFCILACIISMVGSSLILHGFGRVDVQDLYVKTEAGTLNGYLMIPDGVSKDNPAPTIIIGHGATVNAEVMDAYSVELARRGYIVFAFNLWGHGDSSVMDETYLDTINWKTNGVYDAVEYISTLDIVDKEKIGLTAHSLGSSSVINTAIYYSNLEKGALAAGVSPEEAKELNKIAAVLSVGYPIEFTLEGVDMVGNEEPFVGVLADLGIILGRHDDFFAFLGNGFLENDVTKGWLYQQTGITLLNDQNIEEGHFYENAETDNSFVAWNPPDIHNTNTYSVKTTSYVIDFFSQTLGAPNELSSTSQVWWIRHAFQTLGLVGLLVLVFVLTSMLLETSYFKDIKTENSGALPAMETSKEKSRYYRMNIITGIVNCFLLIPVQLFASMLMPTSIWPQGITTSFALWACVSGLFSLLMLRIGGVRYRGYMREHGFIINKQKFGKTLLLAILTSTCVFSIIAFAKYAFNTDFRVWFIAFRPFGIDRVIIGLKYLPIFLIFFLASGFAMSRNNFVNWSKKRRFVTSMLFSVFPVALMLLITYIPILFTGYTAWGSADATIISFAMANASINLFPFLFTLGAVVFYNIKFYEKTGNPWLAAWINSLLFTMMTVSNTSVANFLA